MDPKFIKMKDKKYTKWECKKKTNFELRTTSKKARQSAGKGVRGKGKPFLGL